MGREGDEGTDRGAANDGPAFTMSRMQLAALVSKAVQEALASGSAAPLLVDKQTLAQKLNCSAAHIDHMRKRGLPSVMLGVSVRFEPAKVLAWLNAQAANGSA